MTSSPRISPSFDVPETHPSAREGAGAERTDAAAGMLALRISEIAAQSGTLSHLAHELADLLVSACAADAVLFFWCRQRHVAAGRVRRSLHDVGSAVAPGRDIIGRMRSLKPSAYRALVAGRLVERIPTHAQSVCAATLALPLGTERPWAVCVLTWDAAERMPRASSELLRRLTPALVTATRP